MIQCRMIYHLKVSLFHNKRTYRVIELSGDNPLANLHETIFNAFGRFDPHLYSFFLSREGLKQAHTAIRFPEYTPAMNLEDGWDVGGRERHDADKTKLASLKLKEKEKFYYLFDFGDEWWHEITVMKIIDDDSSILPRVIKTVGEAPGQYSDVDYE